MKLRLLKIINRISSMLFLLSGLLICYGVFIGNHNNILINIFVGSCFIGFGIFNFFKMKTFISIFENSEENSKYKIEMYELASQIFVFLVSLITISGIASRVFMEKTSVFD